METVREDPLLPFKPKSPHPFQTTLLEEIYKLIRGGYLRIVAQLPTGGGKTFVASIIIRGAIGHGKRVAFIAPALGLIDQTVAVLHSEGITDVGVMQAYHELTDHRCAVQVCTIQTLSRRGLPDVDVIIIDEVHIGNKFFQKIFEDQRFKDKVIIGLSATPWSKGLGKRFQKLTTGATTKQLQDLGFLAPFRVFAPGKSADLSGVHTRMGDYVEGELGHGDEQGRVGRGRYRYLEGARREPTDLCVRRQLRSRQGAAREVHRRWHCV